jgi:hypothetical protein
MQIQLQSKGVASVTALNKNKITTKNRGKEKSSYIKEAM